MLLRCGPPASLPPITTSAGWERRGARRASWRVAAARGPSVSPPPPASSERARPTQQGGGELRGLGEAVAPLLRCEPTAQASLPIAPCVAAASFVPVDSERPASVGEERLEPRGGSGTFQSLEGGLEPAREVITPNKM